MPSSMMRLSIVLVFLSGAGNFGCRPLPADSDAPEPDSDVPEVALAPIALGTFNTESGGSRPATVAEAIAEVEGESLWGLSEVEYEDAAEVYAEAAGDDGEPFQFEVGTTGGSDRLVAAWDGDHFEKVDSYELDELNPSGTVRAPLVVQLRERETGFEFLFVVNHLSRGNDAERREQAEGLNDWARGEDLPILAVGDYNFDWSIEDGEHDVGYDRMTEDGIFEWIQPDPLEKTHCSGYRSILDFVFVAGDFHDWAGESEVLQATNAYCVESDERSDHRPVWAKITPP